MLGIPVSIYLFDIDNTLLGFFGIHASLTNFTLITLSSIIKKKVPRRNPHSTQVLLYTESEPSPVSMETLHNFLSVCVLFGFVLPDAGMDFFLVLSHDLLGSTSGRREAYLYRYFFKQSLPRSTT